MKRNIVGPDGRQDVKDFKKWLRENYPGVKIPLEDTSAKVGTLKLWNAAVLVAVVSAVLVGLTRFKIGIPSHACWLLLWMYGGPLFRWKWLIVESMEHEPCLSFGKWCAFELCRVLAWPILVGVYGGITVISVELLGEFCKESISLSAGIWILIGGIILLVLLIIGGITSFYSNIAGIPVRVSKLIAIGFLTGKKSPNSASPTQLKRAWNTTFIRV